MARPSKITTTNPSFRGLASAERKRHLRRLQKATPNVPQDSLLFSLPPELRNSIYYFVLVSDEFVELNINLLTRRQGVKTRAQKKAYWKRPVVKEPTLLQTCRIIRSEATKMYYALNTFLYTETRILERWLRSIGPKKQVMLRDVAWRTWRSIENLPPELVQVKNKLKSLALLGLGLNPDVLRVYFSTTAPRGSIGLTRDEIAARMTEEQWTEYHDWKRMRAQQAETRRLARLHMRGRRFAAVGSA